MELFPHLPDETRTWFYSLDRALDTAEQTGVLQQLQDFVGSWESHGRKVIGDAAIIRDRIVVIAGIIPDGDVSGCGVDASTQLLKRLAERFAFGFCGPLDVLYRDSDSTIQTTPRKAFATQLAQLGNSSPLWIYDLSVLTLGSVRDGLFEIPVRRSWFNRYLTMDPA